jgi:DNA polymerase III subunit delta'
VSPAKAQSDAAVVPHPRETFALFGHAAAERALLDEYRSGRIAHAWLIGGPAGIGKATLAYRMARFALAHPDPKADAVQRAGSLDVPPESPVARRVAGRAHPDLLVLEREPDDKGKMRTVITVDQVRRTIGFFGSTAGEGGWRVCIIDSADELQYPQGSNALLKVLEEPPPRSLFLVVSHAPGRLLPTIRSRCRRLTLRPLGEADVVAAAAAALGDDADEATLRQAAAAADGSVARAIALNGGPQLALRDKVIDMLSSLPATDPRALHALGDSLERGGDELFEIFIETAQGWLSGQLDRGGEPGRLARVAEAWDRLNRAATDTEIYNLERKPLVFNVFGLLAEAARG